MPRKTKGVAPVIQFEDVNAFIGYQVDKTLERNRVLQAIVDKGDRPRSTATGTEQLDLRTCSCGSYEKYRKDHKQDCKVTVVTDPLPVIQALREIRLNESYIASLRSQLVAPDQSEEQQIFLDYIHGLADDNDALKAENARLKAQLARLLAEPVEVLP